MENLMIGGCGVPAAAHLSRLCFSVTAKARSRTLGLIILMWSRKFAL